jgi:hypothetical protein
MSKIVLPIGSINLLIEEGVQKLEITLSDQIDLAALLTNTFNTIPSKGLCSFQDYFERQILNLDLPLTTYRQKHYYAFKASHSSTNLCYYHSNERSKYLNVSVKEDKLGQVFKLAPNDSSLKEYFWVESSYEQFQEEWAYTEMSFYSLLNKYIDSRLAIPVDTDTRFRDTKRVRLYSTGEIDSFLAALLPVLTDHITLNN